MSSRFEFTNDWVQSGAQSVWGRLIPRIHPTRILAVGSCEGASARGLIQQPGAHERIELHCADNCWSACWRGKAV